MMALDVDENGLSFKQQFRIYLLLAMVMNLSIQFVFKID